MDSDDEENGFLAIEDSDDDQDIEDLAQENEDDSIFQDREIDIEESYKKNKKIIPLKFEDNTLSDIIQSGEAARIIGTRASQIEKGSDILVDISGLNISSPIDIAILEIKQKRCPLTLRRPNYTLSNSDIVVEYWPVNELEFPEKYFELARERVNTQYGTSRN